jgi:hypothetical protein
MDSPGQGHSATGVNGRRAAGGGLLLAAAVTLGYVTKVHDPNVTQLTPRLATVASTLPPGGLVQLSPSPASTAPLLPPTRVRGPVRRLPAA